MVLHCPAQFSTYSGLIVYYVLKHSDNYYKLIYKRDYRCNGYTTYHAHIVMSAESAFENKTRRGYEI
jgi:hypothetical protein